MNILTNVIFTEKWRPVTMYDLVFNQKDLVLKYLKTPLTLPSFIFYSSSPGTGKTSLAKIINNILQCDILLLNASSERGVDTVRDKVRVFSQSMSSNENTKRMVFMDEADFITPVGQASLRNIIEEYSDNVFFVFTANDISKIIEPIRSRCVSICFDNPLRQDILTRLEFICEKEGIKTNVEDLKKLIDMFYPDIRSMIIKLGEVVISEDKVLSLLLVNEQYMKFFDAIKKKDIEYLRNMTYSSSFNIMAFNKWFFKYIYNNHNLFNFKHLVEISQLLADTEKSWNMSANLPVIFLSNIIKISYILSS
jgi:DNA polymerase III delta prime subunit